MKLEVAQGGCWLPSDGPRVQAPNQGLLFAVGKGKGKPEMAQDKPVMAQHKPLMAQHKPVMAQHKALACQSVQATTVTTNRLERRKHPKKKLCGPCNGQPDEWLLRTWMSLEKLKLKCKKPVGSQWMHSKSQGWLL